jgi:hypothetical protein
MGINAVKRLLPLLSLLVLAGCYAADKSILPADQLVTPYSKIAYVDESDQAEIQHVLTRSDDGKSYVETNDDGSFAQRIRLLPVGTPDWYVVEMTASEGDDARPNYAYLHVDLAQGEAQVFMGKGDSTIFEGARLCDGGDVCIDDLDSYRRFAEAQITQGAAPDTAYVIRVEE